MKKLSILLFEGILALHFFASCVDHSDLFESPQTPISKCLSEEEAIDIALSFVDLTRSEMDAVLYTEVITSDMIAQSQCETRAADQSLCIDTLMYLVKGLETPILLSAKRGNPVVYAIFDHREASLIDALRNPSDVNYGLLSILSKALLSSGLDYENDPNDNTDPTRPDDGYTGIHVTPVTVGPKIPVEWDQWSPFNRYCPTGCPAGCVAIATAQAMMVTRHVGRFNGIDLNYDSLIRMKDRSKMALYPAQADTIAMLVRQIGNAVGMDYSTDGSGARTSDAIDLFTFGGFMYLSTNKSNIRTTLEDYNDGIVIISSRTQTDFLGIPRGKGHCYVVDGFKIFQNGRDLLHVNYGQGPGYNGYFLSNLMAPYFTDDAPFTYPHEWKFYCLYNH